MVGKQIPKVYQINDVDFIECIIQEHVDHEFMKDPIERSLVWSEPNDQLESECIGFRDLSIAREGSDYIMHVGYWTPTFEPIAPSAIKLVPSTEQPPILDIKLLPSTLKYAFLGESESYPVVISSSMFKG